MKIEEMFRNEPNEVKVAVRITTHPITVGKRAIVRDAERKEFPSLPYSQTPQKDLKIQRNSSTTTNMKMEQLHRHEEISYIEDAEANEAILKNTISKDELCKYLSPLKFFEIETWRREVPCGESPEAVSNDHRKWRTPTQILLPDTDELVDDCFNQSADESRQHSSKVPTFAQASSKRASDNVPRQNDELSRRPGTEITKQRDSYIVRPRIRDTYSAGEKTQRHRITTTKPTPERRSTEELLKDTSTSKITFSRNLQRNKNNRNSDHIYINSEVTGAVTHAAAMTSYFTSTRPMSSPKMPIQYNRRNGKTLARNSLGSGSSLIRISPLPSRGVWNAGLPGSREEMITGEGDVKVIPFNSINPSPPHESNLSRFSRLHASPETNGASWMPKTKTQNRPNATSLPPKGRALDSATIKKCTSLDQDQPTAVERHERQFYSCHADITHVEQTEDAKMPREFPMGPRPRAHKRLLVEKANGDVKNMNVPMISNGNLSVLSSENSPSADAVPTIFQQKSSNESAPSQFKSFSSRTRADIRTGDQRSKAGYSKNTSSPWVSEAFILNKGGNEGYYTRKQKMNKTVTFRLSALPRQPDAVINIAGGMSDKLSGKDHSPNKHRESNDAAALRSRLKEKSAAERISSSYSFTTHLKNIGCENRIRFSTALNSVT